MPYATRDDLVEAVGQDMVDRVSIRAGDEDGSRTLARALDYADAIIDGQLSARFALPLAVVPVALREVAVDLAISRMADSADVITEELRRRQADARSTLEKIASGKMNLGLPSTGPADSPRPVHARIQPSGDKLFARDSLRDF